MGVTGEHLADTKPVIHGQGIAQIAGEKLGRRVKMSSEVAGSIGKGEAMKEKTYLWVAKIPEILCRIIAIILWIPVSIAMIAAMPGLLFWMLGDKAERLSKIDTKLYNRLVPLNKRSTQRWCLECGKHVPVDKTFCGLRCGGRWINNPENQKQYRTKSGHWTYPVNTQLWCN